MTGAIAPSATGGARVGSRASGSGGGSATVTDRDGVVEDTGRDRTTSGGEFDGWASGWRAPVAVLVVPAAGASVRRVTVPGREKSRNCSGPIVPGAGGGAGVTALVVACCAASGDKARLAAASATPHFTIVTPPIRIDCMILLNSRRHLARSAPNGR